MRRRAGFFLVFLMGVVMGLLLSFVGGSGFTFAALGVVMVMAVSTSIWIFRRRHLPPSYDELAQELFVNIKHDVNNIQGYMSSIKNWQLRQQLELICEDILVLMDKVAEKAPESRLTTGKFIRGYLDFILSDILPQYVEMQDTPRYYDLTEDKMEEGFQAIRIFGTFLHNRIVELELADDMRYAVAIEMLKSLNAYTNGNGVKSQSAVGQ